MIKHVAVLFALSAAISTTSAAEPVRQLASSTGSSEPTTRVIVKYKTGVAVSLSNQGPGGAGVFEVAQSDSEAFAEQMMNRPEVEDVAVDVIARNPPLPQAPAGHPMVNSAGFLPTGAPSDPGFNQQRSWLEPTYTSLGYQDILNAYLTTMRERSIRVGVLDSGFHPVADLDWSEGYNLSVIGAGVYNPDFYENTWAPNCTSPHGNAVAGIIGAKANNGVGIAGVTDAELVAARVLECDSGSLYDASIGIRWLAGDPTIEGVPAISEPVQIMNASLGAQIDYCPFYVQEAINYAHERGILVIVAAGNENIDASLVAPANCENVITVGSVNMQGDGSGFSNFGSAVDITALGEMVGSLSVTDVTSQWYGTSFAAPIVAGISALMMQANPALDSEQVANTLVSTARSQVNPTKGLGVIADAGRALGTVNAQLNANRPDVRLALNSVSRCNEQAYLLNEPAGMDFRAAYEVSAGNIFRNAATERFAVFKTNSEGVKELVKLSDEDTFILNGVDIENDQVWFDVCDENALNCRFGQSLPI
ncbi:S8 family peptidase [Marinobacter salicampi]|uniref:S8 family peptidase n=1 Tax=Marinobacter salicampi TaxID=435907 RepID=UPI00140E3017|nr:S8 family serine peptidase [Marinobacter salicampi]